MMMRLILTNILLLISIISSAQSQRGANWVFGDNCGLRFNNTGAVNSFKSKSTGYSSFSSISDESGMLQFYVSERAIFNSQGDTILNGENLNHYDVGRNVVIFPKPNSDSLYLIYHIGELNNGGSNFSPCLGIYTSEVVGTLQSGFKVLSKNVLVYSLPVIGKIRAIQHSNGIDWWLIVHKSSEDGVSFGSNSYLTIKITTSGLDTIIENRIGTAYFNSIGYWGDIVFNKWGNNLVDVITGQGQSSLYDFDRCTGLLRNHVVLSNLSNYNIGSVAFSPNGRFLYVSEQESFGNMLYQLDLNTGDIDTIWEVNNSDVVLGFLEIGLNNKIYVGAILYPQADDSIKHAIGVINQPDSIGIACDFRPFGVSFDSTCLASYGLPNMPNYNLGATTIYQAGAGVDTFYCTTDTTKGVTIGANPINGVTYQWQNNDIAEPDKLIQIVKPPTSTWYYLQITDTTIVGSCTSRIDSVFVEVRVCVGIEELEELDIRVYPNPTSGSVSVILNLIQDLRGETTFSIYNLLGEQVLSHPITQSSTQIAFDLPQGVYIYKVVVDGAVMKTDKLVVVE